MCWSEASLCAGHYVADVYNLEQQQWYHYDDEEVSHPTQDEVVGCARQRNGYIFCYMHRYVSCFWFSSSNLFCNMSMGVPADMSVSVFPHLIVQVLLQAAVQSANGQEHWYVFELVAQQEVDTLQLL
jgi:hypothetical protein